MEGKTVILSVLILSLVMAQIELGAAANICCPSSLAKQVYYLCIFGGGDWEFCTKHSGCNRIEGKDCPSDYPVDSFDNSGDLANGYCKLGCASHVCGPITSLQKSDESEMVNGAVEQCTKACASLCNKGFTTPLKTA